MDHLRQTRGFSLQHLRYLVRDAAPSSLRLLPADNTTHHSHPSFTSLPNRSSTKPIASSLNLSTIGCRAFSALSNLPQPPS